MKLITHSVQHCSLTVTMILTVVKVRCGGLFAVTIRVILLVTFTDTIKHI